MQPDGQSHAIGLTPSAGECGVSPGQGLTPRAGVCGVSPGQGLTLELVSVGSAQVKD